ncbi:MAG TPA: NHLP bacteriocin system secretion protein [Candidatus Cloacimonadota bacterium]|jgi:hypothetical protein|nr:NHLP bacteriocin system secretion protein [Candidatus Cloacimonadota bacterium]
MEELKRHIQNSPGTNSSYRIIWIVLLTIFLLISGLLLWGFLGVVDINLNAEGMLVSDGGFYSLYSHTNGQIYDISVKTGDYVKKGDVIARIDKPEIIEQITQLKQRKHTEQEVHTLQQKFFNESTIISGEQGKVIESVLKGTYVNKGDQIIRISRSGETIKDLVAVLYYPIEQGKNISTGMRCKISPSTVSKEEYGYLTGVVVSVSEFPVNEKRIFDFTGNATLAENYAQRIVLEVIVDLNPSEYTKSGYQWTSSKGPAMKIEPGTLCDGNIVIRKMRPIEFIIPNLKL